MGHNDGLFYGIKKPASYSLNLKMLFCDLTNENDGLMGY